MDWHRTFKRGLRCNMGTLGEHEVVVAGSADGRVYVWDESGETLWVAKEPKGGVGGVAVGKISGQDMVVAESEDGNVYVWDEDGNLL